MNRLGLWQRFGIVLTPLWIIGSGIYQHNASDAWAETQAHIMFNFCIFTPTTGERCQAQLAADEVIYRNHLWDDVAAMAFLPPLIAWIAIPLVISIARWVWAGRRL